MWPQHYTRWGVLALALVLGGWSWWGLERLRGSVDRAQMVIGETPATLYAGRSDDPQPVVVMAHGFAGSRQFMEALALTVVGAGYPVLSYDLLGHGRNPGRMSPEINHIEGTTRGLMDELARVVVAARTVPGGSGEVVLLGHSMATDVVIRESLRNGAVRGVIAISMYSEAITATDPQRLLILAGEWEPHLRAFAEGALQLVDADAEEGQTAVDGAVWRRATFAPNVEHVGVLYAATTFDEVLGFLAETFGRENTGSPALGYGTRLAVLLGAILLAGWAILTALPQGAAVPRHISGRTFAAATLAPALLAPSLAALSNYVLDPVQVIAYLALHFGLYGLIQLALLWRFRGELTHSWAAGMLIAFGIGVFGMALDRFGASFFPSPARWPLIGLLLIGTLPCMWGDAILTQASTAPVLRRILARLALILSLVLSIPLGPERFYLMFMVLPVIVLFFLVFATMGGWVGRRMGAWSQGLGLGALLAWSIAVSFPLFAG